MSVKLRTCLLSLEFPNATNAQKRLQDIKSLKKLNTSTREEYRCRNVSHLKKTKFPRDIK